MADQPTPLAPEKTKNIVAYNIALSAILAFALYQVVLMAARRDLQYLEESRPKVEKTVTKTFKADTLQEGGTTVVKAAPDSIVATTEIREPAATMENGESSIPPNLQMITYVLWAVLLAGGLGGTLSNMRAIFEYYRDYGFLHSYMEMPFYLRPISGMLCGLFTFFLARFFTIALSNGENLSGWQTLEGMLPYIGVALLAGFASQEFMERLRETAKTFFGTNAPPAQEVIMMDSRDTDVPEGEGTVKESISGSTGKRGGGKVDLVDPEPADAPKTRASKQIIIRPAGPTRRLD